jgi:hypothetical protein
MTLRLGAPARAILQASSFLPIELISESDLRALSAHDLHAFCSIYGLGGVELGSGSASADAGGADGDRARWLQHALDAHCAAHLRDKRDYAPAVPIETTIDAAKPAASTSSLHPDPNGADAISNVASEVPVNADGADRVTTSRDDDNAFTIEVAPGVLRPVAVRGVAVGEGMLKLLQCAVVREMFEMLGDEFIFNHICQGRGVSASEEDQVTSEELEVMSRFLVLEQSRQRNSMQS